MLLGGSVTTYRARSAREEDARVIRGVKEVRDDIVVRYPTTVRVPTDDEIGGDIRNSLVLDPDIDDTDIEVTVDAELERRFIVDPSDTDLTVVNGYVTLQGTGPIGGPATRSTTPRATRWEG